MSILIGGVIPPATDLYVSNSGSDSNTGTIASPWATIAKVNASFTQGKTVHFKGGDTFSGTALALQSSTAYDSYGTGRGIISGGQTISTWTQVDVPNNIWRATWNAGRPRQLYVNGTRVVRARTTTGLPASSTVTGTGYSTAGSASPGFMSTWGNKADIEFVYFVEWRNSYCPVASVSGNAITMLAAPFADVIFTADFGGFTELPTYIENAYEIFTANNAAGTFYHDRTAGFVYLIPPAGVSNPNSATVIAPVIEQLCTASGISNATVTNLEFAHTTNLEINTDGFAEVQANALGALSRSFDLWKKPKGAISIQSCTNVVVTLSLLRHLGAAAIDVGGVSVDCVPVGNIIYDVSGNGIQIGGPGQYLGSQPVRYEPNNNVIAECGMEFKGGLGIMQWWANSTNIHHNLIKYMPYSGVGLGLGWGYEQIPSGTSGTIVNLNIIHDVNEVQNDGACIYVNSRQASSSITSNYCYNSGIGRTWGGPNPANFNGIYLDDASQGWTVQNNVCALIGTRYFFCYDNIDSNVFTTNTTDGGSYDAVPGVWTVAPNTYDTLNVVSTAAAQAAGDALGAGLQPAYASVLAEANTLIP